MFVCLTPAFRYIFLINRSHGTSGYLCLHCTEEKAEKEADVIIRPNSSRRPVQIWKQVLSEVNTSIFYPVPDQLFGNFRKHGEKNNCPHCF